jgi:hypothetical protein
MNVAGPDMSMWLQQLVYHAPSLLVYLAAFILAIVYWNRARTAALLTMIGVLIAVATSLGYVVLQATLMQAMQQQQAGNANIAQMMSGLGITSSCSHAVALGLFVAAIFVGRNPPPSEHA